MATQTALGRMALEGVAKNITVARKRRRLTQANMALHCGMSPATYKRIEAANPNVAVGAWIEALAAVGLHLAIVRACDPVNDSAGMAMDIAKLPERVRQKKGPDF